MRIAVSASVLAFATIAAALANDSSAELATGGLLFTKTNDIEMRSEDLYVSTREIGVRYVFFNRAPFDVTTLVAFPMPQIRLRGPDDNIAVPTEDLHNILGFSTIADGKPVASEIEQKAFAGANDITAYLRQLGISLAPHLRSTLEALDRLPQSAKDELVRLGLAEVDEYDVGKGMEKHLRPSWALQTTYYWRQTFASQRETIVEHHYQPSVGQTVQTSLGSPTVVNEDWFARYKTKYCMDSDFLSAIGRARRAAKMEFGAPYSEARIEYILTTGANWSGPIGEFRLVVDKGEPSNLVSFCGEGVKKIAPTRFELRKTNFTPTDNFAVLVLRKIPPQ